MTRNVAVDFYITVREGPVESYLVAAVVNRAKPVTIAGYEVSKSMFTISFYKGFLRKNFHVYVGLCIPKLVLKFCMPVSVFFIYFISFHHLDYSSLALDLCPLMKDLRLHHLHLLR